MKKNYILLTIAFLLGMTTAFASDITAELVHTSSSSSDGNKNFTSTVDSEKEHINNAKFGVGWAGAAYAEFKLAIPAGEAVESARLVWKGIGSSKNRTTDVMYVGEGVDIDYGAMDAGTERCDLLPATVIENVSFPANATTDFTTDVTDAVKTIAAKQDYIIFKWTGNAGGGDLVGKGAADGAPVLLITTVSASSMAEYTIRFVDGNGTEIKAAETASGIIGSSAKLDDEHKASFFDAERTKKYIYVSDDAEGKTIESTGTVVTVTFREAGMFAYTIVGDLAGKAVDVKKGTDFEGETFNVGYPQFALDGGQLFETGKHSSDGKGYYVSLTLNEDNTQRTLTYNDTQIAGVMFLAEGEDVEGLTRCASANTGIRSSNGGSAYNATDANVAITTLAPGKYKLHAVVYDATKSFGNTIQLAAGATTMSFTTTQVNYQPFESEEFEVTANTPLEMLPGGSDNVGLDLVYVVKTGDVEITEAEGVIDFTAMDLPTSNNSSTAGDITADTTFVTDNFMVTISPKASGSTENRFWLTNNAPELRMYNGNVTVEAKPGYNLTRIAFDRGKSWEAPAADYGTVTDTVWTCLEGEATSKVVFTFSAKSFIQKIIAETKQKGIEFAGTTPEAFEQTKATVEALPATLTFNFTKKVASIESAQVIADGDRFNAKDVKEKAVISGNSVTIDMADVLATSPLYYGVMLSVKDASGEYCNVDGMPQVTASFYKDIAPVKMVPEAGTSVGALSKIDFWVDSRYGAAYPEITELSLTDAEGTEVAKATLSADDMDWDLYHVVLDKEITTPGTYTLTIPANAFSTNMGFEFYNKEMKFDFNVGSAFEFAGTTPAAFEQTKATVEALPATLTFNFTKEVASIESAQVIPDGDRFKAMDVKEKAVISGNSVTIDMADVLATSPLYYGVMLSVKDASGEYCNVNGMPQVTASFYKDIAPVKMVPEAGASVETLSKIDFWVDSRYGAAYPEITELSLTDAEGAEVAKAVLSADDMDWDLYHVVLDKEITTPGTYTLTIPANAFSTNMGFEFYNKEMKFDFTVGAAQPVVIETVEGAYETTGKTLAELPKKIEIVCTGDVKEVGSMRMTVESNWFDQVYLGDYTTVEGNKIIVDLEKYYTATGAQEPLYFYLNLVATDMDGNYIAYKGNTNPTFGFLSDFNVIAVSPENNSTVEQLSEINLTVDERYNISNVLKSTLDVVDKATNEVVSKATMTLNTDDFGVWNKLKIKVKDAITANGTYQIVVPAEAFDDGNVEEYTIYNSELVLEYTVQTSVGINGITVDGKASADVYTVSGVMVRKAGDSLEGLAKGVYVINGKKVVVK